MNTESQAPKLSIVIPAYNEELNIITTLSEIEKVIKPEEIPYEIVVVNDNSSDGTLKVVNAFSEEHPEVRCITNTGEHGYGAAVQMGLNNFTGDCVVITMADLSDDPKDIVKFYRTLYKENVDMVFGNRWSKESQVTNYPKNKLYLNRLVNHVLSLVFLVPYKDLTNGFKMFRRTTLEGLRPFIARKFNFALELPLKAVVRGYSYRIVPNDWHAREIGESNLKIKEMFLRYTFTVIECLNERYFSMGDFKKHKDV